MKLRSRTELSRIISPFAVTVALHIFTTSISAQTQTLTQEDLPAFVEQARVAGKRSDQFEAREQWVQRLMKLDGISVQITTNHNSAFRSAFFRYDIDAREMLIKFPNSSRRPEGTTSSFFTVISKVETSSEKVEGITALGVQADYTRSRSSTIGTVFINVPGTVGGYSLNLKLPNIDTPTAKRILSTAQWKFSGKTHSSKTLHSPDKDWLMISRSSQNATLDSRTEMGSYDVLVPAVIEKIEILDPTTGEVFYSVPLVVN